MARAGPAKRSSRSADPLDISPGNLLPDDRRHTERIPAAAGSSIRGQRTEVFTVPFLNNRPRPITCEELFQGTISGATVHLHVLVRKTLGRNAAAIVCALNHPPAVAEPSHSDRAITKRLGDALALVEVRLFDRFVVGVGNECTSPNAVSFELAHGAFSGHWRCSVSDRLLHQC